jgi:hypothetical protein
MEPLAINHVPRFQDVEVSRPDDKGPDVSGPLMQVQAECLIRKFCVRQR